MTLLLLLACAERPGGPPTVNGDPDHDWPALPALDQSIVEIMGRDSVPGLSACMVVDGEVTWCNGYGERNTDSGDLAYANTPFLLASVSKAVTAVAIMQAVEDGHLSLDAPIGDTLDFDVVHPDEPGTPITLRHLMGHTSGIADNWDVMDAHYVEGDSTEPLGEFLKGYLSVGGPDYSESDNFLRKGVEGVSEYSNIGAALAGYMVEAATGAPFDDYCDQHIFAPLAMNAGWHLADFDEADVAMPTRLRDGEFVTVPHFGVPDYPDGQLRADAHSMATFLAMVDKDGVHGGEPLLSAASVDALLTPAYADLDANQGLLWYWWRLDGDDVWGHNGGETGTSTEIVLRDEDGVGAVVLMNGLGGNDTLADVEKAVMAASADL